PLLDLRLFANGPFLASNLTNVLVTFAFFGGIFLFPIYMQSLRGFNAFQSGLMLLFQAFVSMASALIGGRLVDRFGVRVVVIPGVALLAVASWRLAFFTFDLSYGSLQVLYILRGIGLGLVIQPLLVAALSAIPSRQFALASSLYTVVRFVSTTLGIAVLATLVQTRAPVHAALLSDQIAGASPLTQLAARLQGLLVLHGADPALARASAIGQVARLVQRQAYMLAIQDA